MRYTKYKQRTKHGLTLIEMLIVVAIVAILATMLIGIAGRISNQSKEQLTKNTFALLNAALGQFRDYEYRYKHPDYTDFKFPLDCNGLDELDIKEILGEALDVSIEIDAPGHDKKYSGCEALYFFLSQVPEGRRTLDRIDSSLITDEGTDGVSMKISIDDKDYPLLRIIDPWDKTLRYDYYNELNLNPDSKRSFPLITSAGPDGDFGTADDITSR